MNNAVSQALSQVVWRRGDELTAAELHDLLRLRIDVFVVEQACAYAETDGKDLAPSTWHAWIISDTHGDGESHSKRAPRIAASVRLLTDHTPPQIGRVVTERAHRGNGLAAALVQSAHQRCDGASFLEAQSHLATWYETLGWSVAGDEFVEDGIPHVPMQRIDRTG